MAGPQELRPTLLNLARRHVAERFLDRPVNSEAFVRWMVASIVWHPDDEARQLLELVAREPELCCDPRVEPMNAELVERAFARGTTSDAVIAQDLAALPRAVDGVDRYLTARAVFRLPAGRASVADQVAAARTLLWVYPDHLSFANDDHWWSLRRQRWPYPEERRHNRGCHRGRGVADGRSGRGTPGGAGRPVR
jgi:hypothetical protein